MCVQVHPMESFVLLNPFLVTGLFVCPLEASGNILFPDLFRGYRKRPVAWNRLMKIYTFLYRDWMSHYFSKWEKQNLTIHVLLFFWVNSSKVKTDMFKVLHYPQPSNFYRFYNWLWIWKCLLGRNSNYQIHL